MFVIGEIAETVHGGRLQLPKEYHLGQKDLFCRWKNKDILILSDAESSLNFVAGRNNLLYNIKVDKESRIGIPYEYEGRQARIIGNITTIEVNFEEGSA